MPRIVCGRPLLTFDPSFYAPSNKSSLQDSYSKAVNLPCEMAVDPSVPTVLGLLRKHATSMPPNRLIIHYIGHGCHPPSGDGLLYFFTEDRQAYKPLKIQNIIVQCQCPLCFIIDSSNASVLLPFLQSKRDIFCFFACGAQEVLPLSTEAPMDIFSFCLLTPFEAAMSCHLRQHGSVYFEQSNPGEEDQAFLRKFFDALLESVFFDVQSTENNELFMRDPSIASITRGFVLAQRVMLRFNLHPVTVPQLEPMSDHYLWEVWDVVLDFCVGLSKSGAFDMIYELFITSFSKFPRAGYFPLLSFLLKVPEYHDRTASTLLDFLDRNDHVIEVASRSTIPKTILELPKPTATVLIVLAKVLSVQKAIAFDQHTPINFAASGSSDVLSAGMLSIACALANQNVPMLAKLTQLCIEHAADCAPYSSILLVLSIARAGKLLTVPHFASEFLPLLDSPRDDIRAAAALLLGTSRDPAVLAPVAALMRDRSPVVRQFALFGTVQLLRSQPNPEIAAMLNAVGTDENEKVKRAWTSLKTVIAAITTNTAEPVPADQICGHDEMLKALVKSVRTTHFVDRMSVNVFL